MNDKLNFINPRVRIAPSPTGFVHIGNLRTFLYNYLFAKHYNGKFLIRIEDTDRTRIVPDAIKNLLEVMKWAGIEADEGPYLNDNGEIGERGDCGPYVQSNRLEIYHKQIKQLIDKNKAYYCFCPKERLEKLREEQTLNKQAPRYDGFCKGLNKEEVQALLAKGTPHVIRYKMPENKKVIFNDLIYGTIEVNTDNLDDFVLLKADGFPTYHFASVVDDHLMKITHVMRSEEWIASTPKHVLLYDAFDWQAPAFAHLPQLLNTKKKKLSKREGDTAVKDFISAGYLKESLMNFLALLGWNAGTEQEIYNWNELINQFSIDNIHKTGAVFDKDKLDWINGLYLRQLSIDEFYEACLPYLVIAGLIELTANDIIITATQEKIKAGYIKDVLTLEQPRIKKLAEIADAVNYFFVDQPEYDGENLIWKKSNKADTARYLGELTSALSNIGENKFTKEDLEKEIKAFIERNNYGVGDVLWPMRYALSGRDKSPNPYELAAALQKEKTLARLKNALKKLE